MSAEPIQPGPIRGAPRRAVYMVLNSVAGGLLLAVILMALWMHSAVESVARGREQELATRVVLKPIVSEGQARLFADRLKASFPDLDITVIGPAEARALLALQEPWMKELPEVQVASLPTTLEIRDPKAFAQPERLLKLHGELRSAQETDFVIFNDYLFERFAAFVRAARGYAGRVAFAMVAICVAVFIVFNFSVSGLKGGAHGPAAAIVFFTANFIGSAMIGVILFRSVRAWTESAYGVSAPLAAPMILLVATGGFVLIALLELKNVRIRRRRHLRVVRK